MDPCRQGHYSPVTVDPSLYIVFAQGVFLWFLSKRDEQEFFIRATNFVYSLRNERPLKDKLDGRKVENWTVLITVSSKYRHDL